MSTHDDEGPEEGQVRCDYCLSWIPADTVVTAEADDYVRHFCGEGCHAAWEADQAEEVRRDFTAHSGTKDAGR